MPSFEFTDSEQAPDIVPAGTYILHVYFAAPGISNGSKTAGAETIKMRVKQEPDGVTIFEDLIFHKACAMRLDSFVKSVGIKAVKGQAVELDHESVLGLRGWADVKVEEWNGVKRNKIARWVTDRESPENLVIEPEEDDNTPF